MRARVALTTLSLATLFALLSGCGNSTTTPAEETTDTAATQEDNNPADAPETDFTNGGACTDGTDVVVRGSNLTPVITGQCGRVHIEGIGITANIKSAQTVSILGEDHNLTGDSWGNVTLQGQNTTLDSPITGDVDLAGTGITLTTTTPNAIEVKGENTRITAESIDALTLYGVKHTVRATTINKLELRGTSNTVVWKEGVKKPDVNEGDNTLKR